MNTVLPAQFMTANTPPRPITNQERTLITGLAEQCQKMLGEHGLGRKMMDGGILPPRFETMGLSGDGRVGLIKLDVSPASLPGKGAVAKATSKPILGDLSGRTGYPWIGVNHTGVTYVIWLEQTKHKPIPNTVTLELDSPPQGRALSYRPGRRPDGVSPLDVAARHRSHPGRWRVSQRQIHLGARDPCGLLPFYSPDELNLALLDAKGVEFQCGGMFHTWSRLSPTSRRRPTRCWSRFAAEMDRRKMLFTEVMARNLEGYNQAARR